MESFEFRAAFHVCSWLRECHSFDRKTTELIQLFQYTTTRSLMIFSVYVRMNNIITRKIERLRALITLAVCTRPNFRRFVPLRFCVAKIWPGTRLVNNHTRHSINVNIQNEISMYSASNLERPHFILRVVCSYCSHKTFHIFFSLAFMQIATISKENT